MHDPGFYPLLQEGGGSCHLIHCEVAAGRVDVAVAVVAPGLVNPWVQVTSEADYAGDRCEVMLPSRCLNASERIKIYAVSLPCRPLA